MELRPKRNVVLFEPVTHPILRRVDPKEVAKFLKERQRYVDEAEKMKQVPTMSVASYKVSIDRTLLGNMHFIGKFDVIAPMVKLENLTSEHIESFVKGIVQHDGDDEVNPKVIERAMKGLRMNMKIESPEARALGYVNDAFTRLEGVGYGNFRETNPKKTIQFLQETLFPIGLKAAMTKHLEYQTSLNKNVKKYIEFLVDETILQDRVYEHKKPKQTKGPTKDEEVPKDKAKPKRPICLHPKCKEKGIRHFVMTECDEATPEEAKKLLYEHRQNSSKKTNGDKKARKIDTKTDEKSTSIQAVFAECEQRKICADLGSDINLLPPDLLATLLAKGAKMNVKTFKKPCKFNLAAIQGSDKEPIHVECDKEVKMTTELRIRHGKTLKIRNVVWLVATTEVEEPLIGEPLLYALGLDAKETLAAACDKYEGSVDAREIMEEQKYSKGSIARLMDSGVYHSDNAVEDDGTEEIDWLDLGEDTKEEMDEAIKKLMDDAVENGLSEKGQVRLLEMLEKYRHVLRLRLGPGDGPAKVEPMRVTLRPGATPYMAKARRYSADQRDFMDKYMDKLEEYEMMRKNENASRASATLLVPKSWPARYRMTFDMKPSNSRTLPVAWPMPHLESELLDLAGSEVYATMDFCSGYWQLPLHEDSQEIHSVMTPRGVYTPTRTLQGAMNSGANFQAKVEPCFKEMRNFLKAWLDDFLIHNKTEKELLEAIETFLRICDERNLKISARKSRFFARSVRWCGRIIDKDGIRCDPSKLSGLQTMTCPDTAGELCQYVYCLQWMLSSIPDFSERVAPLREVLKAAFTKVKSRKKKYIEKIRLKSIGWGSEHLKAFISLQDSVKEAVELSQRDYDKVLCIFTDASDLFWAAVVTQCNTEELNKTAMEQVHEPLGFLGSAFTDTARRWSTYEKEGFAIFTVFRKMDYMFMVETDIHVFSDHRNLLFVYNPRALEPALGRYVVTKVQRWALYLSRFSYVIEHIDGDKNVMADIMTRWFAGYRGKQFTIKRVTLLLQEQDIVESPMDEGFEWPSEELVKKEQEKFTKEGNILPKDCINVTSGCYKMGDKIWIPPISIDLQLKLLTIGHCGCAGHRGFDSTLNALKEVYIWDTMADDCKEFIRNCIHCLVSKTGNKIPRPLSTTHHATEPNQILHFDFLFMGKGSNDKKYLLVLRDDLSSYLWLCPAIKADAEEVSNEIARWIRTFTAMKYWVSDQGSHFKNEVMKCLAKTHNIKHSFTIAYSPWVNGTVENCMRHTLAACKALQSEMKLGPHDWPAVVGMVMTTLNEAPLKRLGIRSDGTYRSPLEVMTGLKPARSHLILENGTTDIHESGTLTHIRALQLVHIDMLQSAFDEMHKSVTKKVNMNRKRHIEHHNKKTNIINPNFNMGDLVLVRRAQDKGHKMKFRWTGPKRITDVLSELVYEVTDLTKDNKETVRAGRLHTYKVNMDGKQVSKKLLEHAEHSEAKFEMIESLKDIGEASDGIFVQVQWMGLPDKVDWTWNSIKDLHEDVPEQLAEFLQKTKKKKLATKANAMITNF